jgi:uncharacterized repeat protein (TIGR01451 family)
MISVKVTSRSLISRLSLVFAIALIGLMLMLWIGPGDPASIAINAGYSPNVGETCFATPDGGITVFSSTDANAVQQAVNAASPGDIVKAAGYCAGVHEVAHAFQTVHIPKPLTLRGGYTATNWSTSFPLTQPTTLDAQGLGRVIYATTDIAVADMTVQNGNIDGVSLCPSGCGGGIFAASSLSLVNVNVLSNTATNDGGGAYTFGVTQLSNSLFQNNQCTNISCHGGGLFVYSTLTLTGTRFVGNTAAGLGGGIYVTSGILGGSNRLVNGLFAGNTASEAAALYLIDSASGSGAAIVVDTTIASPTLGGGSAIDVGTGAVNITNTIIASYTIGISNAGGMVVEDYDLFFGNTITSAGLITHGGHSFVNDPGFIDPHADDYHLNSASAAIDRGVDVGVYTDLDGTTRPQGTGYDIGAYEAPGFADLSVVKSVTPTLVVPGTAITYTLVFSNEGSLTATEVLITDSVPTSYVANVTYTATLPITSTGSVPYVWAVDDLAPGETDLITVTGIVSPGLRDTTGFTSTARISSSAMEVITANNSSSVGVMILYDLMIYAEGDGLVTKEPIQSGYFYGDAITLTALPAANWLFANWSGDLTGTSNPATILLYGNTLITATFVAECASITGTAISFTPIAPKVDQPVVFTATITGGTVPITYTWDFDHDSIVITNTANIVHRFPLTNTVHTYLVMMTASNACSNQAAEPRAATVQVYTIYLPVIIRN